MTELEDYEELQALEAAESTVPAVSIPVVRGSSLHSKLPLVTGFIPLRALLGRFTVPYYNPVSKVGYQRAPQKARISQFATALRTGNVDLPNSVMFNIRNPNATDMLEGGLLNLPALTGDRRTENLLHVVDGQHRVLALRKALFDGWTEGADFQIPFVCMLGADDREEMKQFYLVNSNAKSVRTDLALAIMKKWSISDPSFLTDLEEKGKAWQVIGQTLVERLANESAIWRNRIRLPGADKGMTTMPSASLVKSLQPVLAAAFFQRLNQDQQLRILNAYWEAINAIIPEAFSHAEDYTIMKGVGVRVLHNILPTVIEAIRDQGKSTADPNNYEEVLAEALLAISAQNANADEVEGKEFWLSGANGGAGSFSSESGIKRLTAMVLRLLPASTL